MDDRPSSASMTRALTAALMGLAVAGAGCQQFQKQPATTSAAKSAATAEADDVPAKPGAPIATILPQWSRKVELGTNPVDNAPMPAIVGRIYFLDAKDLPADCDGKLTIQLFDDTNRRMGKPCELMGTWNLDRKQLAKWKSKDSIIGNGYSLALPWPSYKPEIEQIHLVVHYTPRAVGQPLTMQDQVMTLEQGPDLMVTQQQTAPVQTAAATNR